MPIVVEDGTGLANANSYASEGTLEVYADNHGVTLATGDAEAALIRATAAIDATYRGRFPGYKTNGRDQALELPRLAGYDIEGNLLPADEVWTEVVNATCEAAIRELIEPGSMMPDLERGGNIKSLKAGSVAIEYGANATARTTFTVIDGILSGILISGSAGGLFGRAVRV